MAGPSARSRLVNLGQAAARKARASINWDARDTDLRESVLGETGASGGIAGRFEAGAPDAGGHGPEAEVATALQSKAHELADRLPDLVLEAMRITNTVTHGIHGRRRAGPGETFWQFRQFGDSDTAQQIDWRRSASSDQLFVREREWEAAHTVWLWSNLSPSMMFQSHLASVTKRDRALILMLAVGELLVRGGERIALLGLTSPSASRRATTRIAEAIVTQSMRGKTGTTPLSDPLPPRARLSRFTGTVLFSDFLEPIDLIRERLNLLAADGVSGHLVQVLDPAEETLPYEGRTEFYSMDGSHRWVADRAESMAARFQQKMHAHKANLEDIARSLGWSFLVHHTNRPASEALLTLSMRLQGEAGNYRWSGGDGNTDEQAEGAAR